MRTSFPRQNCFKHSRRSSALKYKDQIVDVRQKAEKYLPPDLPIPVKYNSRPHKQHFFSQPKEQEDKLVSGSIVKHLTVQKQNDCSSIDIYVSVTIPSPRITYNNSPQGFDIRVKKWENGHVDFKPKLISGGNVSEQLESNYTKGFKELLETVKCSVCGQPIGIQSISEHYLIHKLSEGANIGVSKQQKWFRSNNQPMKEHSTIEYHTSDKSAPQSSQAAIKDKPTLETKYSPEQPQSKFDIDVRIARQDRKEKKTVSDPPSIPYSRTNSQRFSQGSDVPINNPLFSINQKPSQQKPEQLHFEVSEKISENRVRRHPSQVSGYNYERSTSVQMQESQRSQSKLVKLKKAPRNILAQTDTQYSR